MNPGRASILNPLSNVLSSSIAVVFAVTVAVGLASCQSLPDEDGTTHENGSLAAQGTVLFVVGSTALSAPDTALRNRLQGLGFTVSAVQAAAAKSTDATGKALVLISESVTSGDVNAKFRTVTVPVLSLENAIFDDMGMTGTVNGTDYGEVANQTDLDILATSHPLDSGLTVTVTSSAQTFAFGKVPAGAARIATIAGSPNQAAIFGYETGTMMVGLAAPARRVGWFAGHTTPSALNKHGWNLFDAAVRWAAVAPVCQSGQTRSCASGGLQGACAQGVQACTSSGTWGACSIQPAPADTCVMGNDANCDGVVNGGCQCITSSQQSCGAIGMKGACAAGVVTCDMSGHWGACSIQPAPADTCVMGNDANCDGIPNEGCP